MGGISYNVWLHFVVNVDSVCLISAPCGNTFWWFGLTCSLCVRTCSEWVQEGPWAETSISDCICKRFYKNGKFHPSTVCESRYSDWLQVGRSGDRIPVGARFFTNVQTGLGAHPASCTMGTRSFLSVKRPGRGADHPPPSSAQVKKG
jgi:hypothetical protein